MADPLTINVQQAAKAAPATYTVAGSAEIEILSAFASFDGTAAAAAYLPSLAFYSAAGLLISRSFPSSSVAAGASADVSYFPGVVDAPAAASGGGATESRVPMDTPDGSGNAFLASTVNNGFTVARRLLPAFPKLLDGWWQGSIRIPNNYTSSGAIVCSYVANAAVGNVRTNVSTAVVAAGVTEDTALTSETTVTTTVPGTARQRFDVSFTLTPTLVAGSTLNVQVERFGTSGLDTLAVDLLLWELTLTYS